MFIESVYPALFIDSQTIPAIRGDSIIENKAIMTFNNPSDTSIKLVSFLSSYHNKATDTPLFEALTYSPALNSYSILFYLTFVSIVGYYDNRNCTYRLQDTQHDTISAVFRKQSDYDTLFFLAPLSEYYKDLARSVNLIKDIRAKTGNDSLPVIIPMITGTNWQYKSIIQAAEIAVAKKTVNADTMSTEGYALSDGIHYNAASMEKIGRICAQRWLAMKFTKDWWKPDTIPVSAVYRPALPAAPAAVAAPMDLTFFDLTGRTIRSISTQSADNRSNRHPVLILIGTASSESGRQRVSKAPMMQR